MSSDLFIMSVYLDRSEGITARPSQNTHTETHTQTWIRLHHQRRRKDPSGLMTDCKDQQFKNMRVMSSSSWLTWSPHSQSQHVYWVLTDVLHSTDASWMLTAVSHSKNASIRLATHSPSHILSWNFSGHPVSEICHVVVTSSSLLLLCLARCLLRLPLPGVSL